MIETTELLYVKYRRQAEALRKCVMMSPEAFSGFLEDALSGMQQIAVEYKGCTGVLFYDVYEESGKTFCYVPAYGYYAENEQMMVRLFQRLAEEAVREKPVEFSVNLYANDDECIRALHMMQFGNMAEKGLAELPESVEIPRLPYDIRPLSKAEIEALWEDVWAATSRIVSHLQKSPVFYPGTEFTEDVYRDFYMGDDVEVIAAFDAGKLVGIIEWNLDAARLLCGEKSVDVGEAYVVPELRGSGLAEALLLTAEKRAKDAGYDYMWVEHGTANPNARGFWNKHFQTFQYELTRTIEHA